MRLFAPRKARSTKAASLQASVSWSGRLAGQLRNVDVLLRLAICGVFLLLMMGVLGSWRAPLPYRLGQHVADGIVARIDFERVNTRKTDLARLETERRVPPVFRQNGEPLRDLENRLRSDLFNVARVHDVSELSTEVRAAFGFATDPTGRNPLPEPAIKDWLALRSLVSQGDMATERRIDEVVGEFMQFTAPIRETGVLDPELLTRLELTPDRPISVLPLDATDDQPVNPKVFAASDAILSNALKAGGRLAHQWNQFPTLMKIQPVLERWLVHSVPPTLTYDDIATNRQVAVLRGLVPLETDKFKRGQLLAAPGAWIDEDTLDILRTQHETLERDVPWTDRLIRLVVVAVLLIVLGGMNAYYLVHNEPRLVRNVGRLTIYLTAITLTVGVGRLLASAGWRAEVVPVLACVMILAIAYNQVLASLTGFSMALLGTLSTGGDVADFLQLMSAIAAAVVPLQQVASRSKVVIVGLWTALTYLLVAFGITIIESQKLGWMWTDWDLYAVSFAGAGWCFATGFLVAGSLPFIEQMFGVVTDISLLELSDISHPLLQELVRRAPGTYNHSITVATIAETAADRIGANGLLCRVGAYFHDIGKMLKPLYFVENMSAGQVSRHQSLNPAMSTLIIIGHVKDGVDLAQQQNLPRPLIDFIEQHHGTTLVEFFFHAAVKQAEQQPEEFRTVVEESSFRYPGPKPQTREAAVMMIADAVEGASRTLVEPTPKRIEELVHGIAMKRLLDGQFDECSLTLSELAQIEDSLTKSLIGMYHGRIKYPEQRTA